MHGFNRRQGGGEKSRLPDLFRSACRLPLFLFLLRAALYAGFTPVRVDEVLS
jgi:hypothetical protein